MFSVEDVTKIAQLSALEVTEEEKVKFAEQFSTILDYFKILENTNFDLSSKDRDESFMVRYRDDKSEASQVTPESFSPYIENNCFKVPKVIDVE